MKKIIFMAYLILFSIFVLFSEEIKYTENEFGTAKADKSHIAKWEKMYESLVNDSPILQSKFIDQKKFFKNYQMIRNIIHVQNPIKDYSIFVVPKEEE